MFYSAGGVEDCLIIFLATCGTWFIFIESGFPLSGNTRLAGVWIMRVVKKWSVIAFFLTFGGTFEQAERWLSEGRTR